MVLLNSKLGTILSLTLLCMGQAHAEERAGFYTIIGPDGQLMVIDRAVQTPEATKTKSKPEKAVVAAINSQPKTTTKIIQQSSVQTSELASLKELKSVAPKPVKSKNAGVMAQPAINTTHSGSAQALLRPQEQNATQPVAEQAQQEPITTIDGEQYVDSEYLEQREFNLEGKKRFYNLPDGLGGKQIVEREKGVDMSLFRSSQPEKPQPAVVLAQNYQRLPKQQVVDLIGGECFSSKQLKKNKSLVAGEYVDFWPKPGFEPKFDFVVAKLQGQTKGIQLTSYANTMNSPEFYWPLPIFLDEQGCVLEGVNGFYLQNMPATIKTHEALQGYLHIPQDTRYILLTPLEAAGDLTQTQLTNKGQIRLTSIR